MTPEQVDFAARFANYEIVLKVSTKRICAPERNDDGTWFLPGCVLTINTRIEQIIVTASDGLDAVGLERIRVAVENFCAGRAWCAAFDKLKIRIDSSDGSEVFQTGWLGWTSDTKWLDRDGWRVTACTDDRCAETWHEYDDTTELGTPMVIHRSDTIKHLAGYELAMVRETAGPWKVEVEVASNELDVFVARSLCNDISWLAIECEKLNATEAVAA